MDLREYTDFRYGYMLSRENEFNNEQHLLHTISGKIAQAVWHDRDFTKQLKSVDWTSGILIDAIDKVIEKKQRETIERIEKQYGVKLEYHEEES